MHTVFLVFIGVLTAQLLYIAANWWQYRRMDYVYYFLYLFVLLHYFLIIGADDIFGADMEESKWQILYQCIRSLAFAGYAIYFRFVKSFLQTKQHSPGLHRGIGRAEKVLWALAGIYIVWEQYMGRTALSSTIYFACSLLIFGATLWLIAQLWRNPDYLSRYILRGAVVLATGAFGTNIIMIIGLIIRGYSENYYLAPLMGGILMEIFFFNNGLTYKSRQTELQLISSQQQVIDELKQKELLQERLSGMRERVSRDLHDELGSGLSSIRLLTETAVMKNNNSPENLLLYRKIAHTAKELGGKINEIIWAGSSTKDNAESLLLFVRQYAHEYLEQANIDCTCLLPQTIPSITIHGELRRHIFLVVKEALHNVVKHAQATEVKIDMETTNKWLSISIMDNGRGFDHNKPAGRGNGLQNMRLRIEQEAGGSFQIHTSPAGTQLALKVAL
jgi:signal transduction histidine kinase